MIVRILPAFAALALASSISAADKDEAKPATPPAKDYVANNASKTFTGTFGGRSVRYTATVQEQVLKGDDGTPKAAIVTTAYIAEPRDPSRPVTFLFNGGPGSGSVWLQMGAFGPKRVAIPSDARDDGGPPYPILDNPDSLLDATDLVFIDPVGTGFSHTIGETKGEDYWGVTKDAKSVAQVIRQWLNDNGRWNSPKFLGGESYGTTRSAAVVDQLEGEYNDVALNGVILLSTVLDFAAGADTPGNELGYITNLPSMATTALYHGRTTAPSAEVIAEEARQFAIGPYAAFLLKGQHASADERAAIRTQLAHFTGLSEQYLDEADLRVTPDRFYKELLRDRGLTVGRLDSRYTGKDLDNAGEYPDNDPSFYGIDGGYTAAMNSWMRDTLGYKTDQRYVTIGSVGPWDWQLEGGRDTNAYLNVAPYLGRALRENSSLRIFVGQGWYDFATPFFAAEYALSRTGFPQDRIQFHYYDAGHMMYVRDEDRHKLAEDVRAFIRSR
jgi:carboxypeptidase C (cathepsin A)